MNYSDSIKQRFCGRHKKCIELCEDVEGKRILDIGCSYGWFEKFAVENKCEEIIAFDIDSKNLFKAKEQVKSDNVKFLAGSVFEMNNFKDNSFDLVVMFDVIEHLPKRTEFKVILEIKRILKKRGELVISTPNKSFFSNILDPMWYLGHRHYSKEQIKKIIEYCNLNPITIEKKGRFYELFSMILLYPFKWVLNSEIPFKQFFDKKRNIEYLEEEKGFATLFVKAVKD